MHLAGMVGAVVLLGLIRIMHPAIKQAGWEQPGALVDGACVCSKLNSSYMLLVDAACTVVS